MDQPLSRSARIGIIHFMLWPRAMSGEGPIAETVERLVADTAFDAIEVTRIADRDARRCVRALCETARVSLAFGAQPILLGGQLDLNALDESPRTAAIEAVQEGIDQAIELGAVGVAVLSGPDPGLAHREQAADLLVDSLKWLCDYAAHKGGLPVALETFDRQPFGKNCLIGPSTEAAEVARRVREHFPSFGLLLDLSHLPLLGETPREALRAAGDALVHAHMGNCVMRDPAHPAYGDNHPRFGVPGGENDVLELAEYLRALLDARFLDPVRRPILSFEVKPLAGESADALIAGSLRTLADAWAAV
jgi:sugar phosphate isomerase/epimerase